MPETHLNAYYQDVEDARQELIIAQAKYDAAQKALVDKEVVEGVRQRPQPVEPADAKDDKKKK